MPKMIQQKTAKIGIFVSFHHNFSAKINIKFETTIGFCLITIEKCKLPISKTLKKIKKEAIRKIRK
jgi:hypothetical protein